MTLFDSLQNLAATDEHLPIPLMAVVERHVLDESDADVFRSGKIREVGYLIIIHSPNYYTVNFRRREARRHRSFNAVKHGLQRIASGDRLKGFGLERVATDGNAIETSRPQGRGASLKSRRISGHR